VPRKKFCWQGGSWSCTRGGEKKVNRGTEKGLYRGGKRDVVDAGGNILKVNPQHKRGKKKKTPKKRIGKRGKKREMGLGKTKAIKKRGEKPDRKRIGPHRKIKGPAKAKLRKKPGKKGQGDNSRAKKKVCAGVKGRRIGILPPLQGEGAVQRNSPVRP